MTTALPQLIELETPSSSRKCPLHHVIAFRGSAINKSFELTMSFCYPLVISYVGVVEHRCLYRNSKEPEPSSGPSLLL